MDPAPRMVEASTGVRFLTTGRSVKTTGEPPTGLMGLSSWQPYPLPGGAVLTVNGHCDRLWLLMQNYVHPIKNYLPNGEVVLHYADESRTITSLIPPYNLDCYFQPFAREGVNVPMGRVVGDYPAWLFVIPPVARASVLEIPCDPKRELFSVELRATCSEGALGIVGLTLQSSAEK